MGRHTYELHVPTIYIQGQPLLICEPRPSFANQSWVDARIRKSGNQNNKNTNTQLRSKLVWFIDQWKGVDWATGLARFRGSHNEQSVGLSVCWRHVGVVVLPLNSQAIVTLVMCCWMYSMHSSTCSRSSWTSDSSSSQRELKTARPF